MAFAPGALYGARCFRGNPVKRSGLTLVEVLIAVAIVGILVAIIQSSTGLVGSTDSRAQVAADGLFDLAYAVSGFEPTLKPVSFRQTVTSVAIAQTRPARLSHLTRPITTTDRNSCNAPYTTTHVARWVGPYYHIEMLTTGTKLSQGFVVDDLMVRTPAAAGLYPTTQAGTLAIRMQNVALLDAQALATIVDGNPSGAGGTVRFTVSGSNPVTVDYIIMVSGC